MHRGQGWRIAIYAQDHGMPHFHIEGPGYRCSVNIETLEVIVGAAPAGTLRAARAWAGENRQVLRDKWAELNQ